MASAASNIHSKDLRKAQNVNNNLNFQKSRWRKAVNWSNRLAQWTTTNAQKKITHPPC